MNNFTVELQDPFSYWILWIIIAAVLLAAAIAIGIIIFRKIKKSSHKKRPPKIKPVPKPTLQMLQKKYLDELWDLRQQTESGRLSMKDSYQNLSSTVRNFVYESTDLEVQCYTLAEIAALRIQSLTQLIDECYEPEFAESSTRNTVLSIDTAANIINHWCI